MAPILYKLHNLLNNSCMAPFLCIKFTIYFKRFTTENMFNVHLWMKNVSDLGCQSASAWDDNIFNGKIDKYWFSSFENLTPLGMKFWAVENILALFVKVAYILTNHKNILKIFMVSMPVSTVEETFDWRLHYLLILVTSRISVNTLFQTRVLTLGKPLTPPPSLTPTPILQHFHDFATMLNAF